METLSQEPLVEPVQPEPHWQRIIRPALYSKLSNNLNLSASPFINSITLHEFNFSVTVCDSVLIWKLIQGHER